MAFDIQDPHTFLDTDAALDCDAESLAETPSTLASILYPSDALEAAQRMQRWYRTTAQGIAHSIFGRDGRRVEGRFAYEAMAQED